MQIMPCRQLLNCLRGNILSWMHEWYVLQRYRSNHSICVPDVPKRIIQQGWKQRLHAMPFWFVWSEYKRFPVHEMPCGNVFYRSWGQQQRRLQDLLRRELQSIWIQCLLVMPHWIVQRQGPISQLYTLSRRHVLYRGRGKQQLSVRHLP